MIREGTVQGIVAAADVAHGREAALQRMRQHAHRVRGAVRLAERLDSLDKDVAGKGVYVRIDQPGHQRASGDVEHMRILSAERLG